MSRVRLNTGTTPSQQLERLTVSHPFVQQIDVIFSSRTTRDVHAFMALKTAYATAEFTMSELYAYAPQFITPDVSFKAVPINEREIDDTWCIDPRGILTLYVSKGLYERLGIVGKKLPFKACPESYVIHIPLKRETTSVGMQIRHKSAMRIWDEDRTAKGLGKWHVAYAGTGTGDGHTTHAVTPRIRHQSDVHVPHVGELTQSTNELAQDHQERLEALFEWVGMACLGAQRLCANDRVDPYVAVYDTPGPALIEDVTHVRWKGVLDTMFVRSVIDTAMSVLSTSQPSGDGSGSFVSVTLHSGLATPVGYVPETPSKDAPLRVPGPEAEDTTCIILSNTSVKSTWAIGECIGKWDTRWG